MKKLLLLTFILLVAASGASAKKTGDKHCLSDAKKKELQEFKLKFLAEEMDLREDQIPRFNETYIQYENERRELIKKKRNIEKKISEDNNVSDAEYEKANKEILETKAKMADVEKKYDEKFSQFLTKKQIFLMKSAEEKFMQKMRGCIDKKRKTKK